MTDIEKLVEECVPLIYLQQTSSPINFPFDFPNSI